MKDKTKHFELYDIIDGWYHEHTRHHLVDVDKDAGKMIAKVETLIDQEVKKARVDELKKLNKFFYELNPFAAENYVEDRIAELEKDNK